MASFTNPSQTYSTSYYQQNSINSTPQQIVAATPPNATVTGGSETYSQTQFSSPQNSYDTNSSSWNDGHDWDAILLGGNATPPLEYNFKPTSGQNYQFHPGMKAYNCNGQTFQSELQCMTPFDSAYLNDMAPSIGNRISQSPPISPSHSLPGYDLGFIPNQESNNLFQPSNSICTGPFGFTNILHSGDDMRDNTSFDLSADQAGFWLPSPQIMNSNSDFLATEVLYNPPFSDGCVKDIDSGNALRKAGGQGHDMIVKLLISRGADIEAQNPCGQTTLHLAAQNGHPNVVRLLLERHANFNIKDNTGKLPFHLAAIEGHCAVMHLLLATNVDINSTDISGQSALHLAAEQGHLGVVQLLVEHGIKLNSRSKLGLTPLHGAAERGRDAVVRLLLERGADANAKSDDG